MQQKSKALALNTIAMGSICICNSNVLQTSLNNYKQSHISDEFHDRMSSTDDDFENRKWHDGFSYS